MKRIFLAYITVLSLFAPVLLYGCSRPGGIMTSATVLQPPTPVATAKNTNLLVYEIYLVNEQGTDALRLDKMEIFDSQAMIMPLAVYQGERLANSSLLVTEDIRQKKNLDIFQSSKFIRGIKKDEFLLKKGTGALIFVWIELEAKQQIPEKLTHRILFTKTSAATGNRQQLIGNFAIVVLNNKPAVIGPPLSGTNWAACGGPAENTYHRKAALAMNGNFFLAQRFAVDWILLDNLGKFANGSVLENNSYLGFGKEVLAVSDGVVVSVSDGMPENIPGTKPALKKIEEAEGNNIVLDIGFGNYVFYAHLQPGSLRVKPNEKVKRGQVIGLLGNTGNSDGPHLHMHVCNGPDPIRSEGLPFVFDSFTFKGQAAGEPNMEKGSWRWKREREPKRVKKVIPLENYVVGFDANNSREDN